MTGRRDFSKVRKPGARFEQAEKPKVKGWTSAQAASAGRSLSPDEIARVMAERTTVATTSPHGDDGEAAR